MGTLQVCNSELSDRGNRNMRKHSKGLEFCLKTDTSVSTSRTSKTLCFITAGLAFVLGIVIGVMIPFYILPNSASLVNVTDGSGYSVVDRYIGQNTVVGEESDSQRRSIPTGTSVQTNMLPVTERELSIESFVADFTPHWRGVHSASSNTAAPVSKPDWEGAERGRTAAPRFGAGRPGASVEVGRRPPGASVTVLYPQLTRRRRPQGQPLGATSGERQAGPGSGLAPASSPGKQSLPRVPVETKTPVTFLLSNKTAENIQNGRVHLGQDHENMLPKPKPTTSKHHPTAGDAVLFIEPERSHSLSTNQTTHPRHPSTQSRDMSVRVTPEMVSNVVDGVYWNTPVEQMLPTGFLDDTVDAWRHYCRHSTVVKVEDGCGRMQNRLVTFENGTRSCCRYRQNFDQIQGEIFSFYLSRLLGIQNLVPSALGLVRPRESQWTAVRSQLSLAQWAEDRPVVFTRFLPDLAPSYIPEPFRGPDRHLHPTDLDMRNMNLEENQNEIMELAQWSDLIVFDYLTANLDRMVNNMYNMQWNPAMMEAPAHNLARNTNTGLLVFLDNESGLLHGYRLLEKYEHYHMTMLESVCVFRRTTAEAIKRLHRDKNVGELLKQVFEQSEPGFSDYLPMLPEKSVKVLNNRIDRVYEQIKKCENLYSS